MGSIAYVWLSYKLEQTYWEVGLENVLIFPLGNSASWNLNWFVEKDAARVICLLCASAY